MTPDDEPKTDAELMTRLFALYAAGDHSGAARDDFWDNVSFHIGWILDLAKRGAKRNAKRKPDAKNGGLIRDANLSPERRSEIAKQAADIRWHGRKECWSCGSRSDTHMITCRATPASPPGAPPHD